MADPPKLRPWQRRPRRTIGLILGLLSIVVMIVFAFMDTAKAATPSQASLFVVIAAGFQIAAAAVFSGEGRADPTHAMSSFRHLARLARRTAEAKEVAERATAPDITPTVAKQAILRLSADLSWIEEELVEAGEHWAQVHPELRPETEETASDVGAGAGADDGAD